MIARRTNISGSTGPIFAIFSPNESVLSADDLDLFFQHLKGRCHGSCKSTVYNMRRSAIGLVYLRSLGGSTVMFC